ncbi:MAG: PqqD family protein [Clostridiales bacterium]|nr:PqqD family protein [Clostridiales bacterium]
MYKANDNIVEREIHGSFFLIDITDNYRGDRCALYEINRTGMFLWKNLSTAKTADELTELLKAAIIDDIDYQIIHSDVIEFLNTLVSKQFILEVD